MVLWNVHIKKPYRRKAIIQSAFRGNGDKMSKIHQNNEGENTSNVVASGEKLSKKQLQQLKERKRKTKRILVWTCIGVLIAAIVAAIVVGIIRRDPPLEKIVVGESEYYQVDASMLAYTIYSNYSNYISTYKDYLSIIGLDTSKSLRDQKFSDTQTWFDYFEETAKNQLDEYVVFASLARKKNMTLTEDDNKQIDTYITSLTASALASKYQNLNSYLNSNLCPGVNENSIRRVLELQLLATDYYNEFKTETEASFKPEDFESFAKEHPELIQKFDYISYTFKPTYGDNATDEEKELALVKAKEEAEKLGKITDVDEFKKRLVEICKENASDKDKDKEIDYITENTKTDVLYTDTNLGNWAKSAKVDDITVLEDKSNDKIVSYTVYLLTKEMHLDTRQSMNVRHILFTESTYKTLDAAKVKANEVFDEWNKGDKTAESFAKLAEKYSEDTGSNQNGGLYTNVYAGQMVANFNEWVFTEGRKAGDCKIIETDAGVHIIYCDGEGTLPCWQADLSSDMVSEAYKNKIEENKALKLTYNEENTRYIP